MTEAIQHERSPSNPEKIQESQISIETCLNLQFVPAEQRQQRVGHHGGQTASDGLHLRVELAQAELQQKKNTDMLSLSEFIT